MLEYLCLYKNYPISRLSRKEQICDRDIDWKKLMLVFGKSMEILSLSLCGNQEEMCAELEQK